MKKKMSQKDPKISIITPSFNQAQFIKKTIDSVLSQKYSNLEYIVIDGGSTDGTIDILKKYGNKLKWISEKDKGQSDAINKGLRKTKGEIVGFINSDDYLEKGTLVKIGNYFKNHKESKWVTGKCHIIDKNGNEVRPLITLYKNIFLKYFRFSSLLQIVNYISQPSTFWRRKIISTNGYFDTDLHYSMDYDYWIRLNEKHKLDFIDEYIAYYRVHDNSKAVSSPENQFNAEYDISKKYTRSKVILFLHLIHNKFVLFLYKLLFSTKKNYVES